MAAGANPRHYALIGPTTNNKGEICAFDPATDMDLLHSAVEQIGGISLLIIDPIISAVTGDMNKVNEVRRNLQPIVDFASVTGCAVLGITHFAKGTAGRNASERVIGSTGFKDLSRVTLAVAKDPETGEHVITRAKSNYSSEGGGFAFGIDVIRIADDITANRIHWGRELKGSSRAILAEVEGDERQEGDKTRAAKQFLIEVLSSGPVPSKEVLRQAREGYGITEDTLRRAYKDIGLKPTRIGFGANGQWMWALPVAIPQR
jgi:RecA-family ATPase